MNLKKKTKNKKPWRLQSDGGSTFSWLLPLESKNSFIEKKQTNLCFCNGGLLNISKKNFRAIDHLGKKNNVQLQFEVPLISSKVTEEK